MQNKHWIGLSGSHRVGKSTLAMEFAEKNGYTFVPTDIHGIQKNLGYVSSKQDYSFKERMQIQIAILDTLSERYKEWHANLGNVITDRTPYDFITYTLLAVNDKCDDEDYQQLLDYIHKCQLVASCYFDDIFVIQPGIPVVADSKSAAASKAFMHKFNSIMLGEVTGRDHIKVMPSYLLHPNNRMIYLENNISKAIL